MKSGSKFKVIFFSCFIVPIIAAPFYGIERLAWVTGICLAIGVIAALIYAIVIKVYDKLEKSVLQELDYPNWEFVPKADAYVTVKSRQTLDKYDSIRFFKENREKLEEAERILRWKAEVAKTLTAFLSDNAYKERHFYHRIEERINEVLERTRNYRILVTYITKAGNNLGEVMLLVSQSEIAEMKYDPSILMNKGEYNRYLRDQQKEAVTEMQHDYYERVNQIIEKANKAKDSLVIRSNAAELDNLIAQLFDRTVNSIKKIKSLDSEEWHFIRDFTNRIEQDINKIIMEDQKIFIYYNSLAFRKIKVTCEALMASQREFNEYISEKVESLSALFGTRVVREETVVADEYNYIRPYKKSITPFTAEVSAAVFASAENRPLDYVVKYFYPNKKDYPVQIRKLELLIEEVETLRDAKRIIEDYKKDYQQYIGDVPAYVMKNDPDGFYSRLGFAYIDESVLTVEYKFSYTSSGGMAQRSFTVPMTEETIADLIGALENKLTASALAKEQRTLMTKKLRESILKRDNYTCRICHNSTYKEPNLLLEVDHIIPVSRGGLTVGRNLQTLCWKCNRSKSAKMPKTYWCSDIDL